MSYDLAAFPREGKSLPAFEEFQGYFKERKHFTLEDNLAVYENEESEAFFIFAYETEKPNFAALGIELVGFDEEEEEDPLEYPLVCFNIQYGFSPQCLDEAEKELVGFFKNFDLLVEDPQIEGMGRGEFSGEGFRKSYAAGNLVVRGY